MFVGEDFAAESESDGASVKARLDAPSMLETLLTWPEPRWATLCEAFLTKPGVTVVGRPSKAQTQEKGTETHINTKIKYL